MTSQVKILWVALIAVAIIATCALGLGYNAATQPAPTTQLGGVTNYDELTLKAPSGTTTLAVYGSNATTGGCIEFNATSSQTKLNMRFSAFGATSTFAGTMYAAYGTCK